MSWTITGPSGTLRVGGRTAAVLGRWTATARRESEGGGWEVRAPLVGRDAHWLAAATALDLCLDASTGPLRWRRVPLERITLTEHAVTITGEEGPESDG